jgi:alkylhydroperoxidase family enzyme
VEAIRHGRPVADERLEALRLFTRAAVEGRGRVPDDVLSRFTAAGWTRRQIVEVFYAMATKEFVYLLQRLADVPLDAPLQGAAWNG